MNWKGKLINWSHHYFKLNDILEELIPHMLQESFNENYNDIFQILIENLPETKKEVWEKSENNVGVHGKDDHVNFTSDRKNLMAQLGRQMSKLEDEMFLKPLMQLILDENEENNDTDIVATIVVEVENSADGKSNKKRKTTKYSKSLRRISRKFDGKILIGRKVCRFFPKIPCSAHKPAYYDGTITAYDKK
jgi:hypothetical protein